MATPLDLGQELRRNLGFGVRLLRKNPGFTATSVVTLGLCIGANAAVFSVVDAVLLRPLPYPAPERLALVVTARAADDGAGSERRISQNGRTWLLVRDGATAVEAAPYSGWSSSVNLAVGKGAERVDLQRVGAGFFHVLGVAPRLGREFTPDEDEAGGPPAAILSDGIWRRVFDGDRAVVGSRVLLRGEPHTVVGVMPEGFRTDVLADVWTPLRPSTEGEGGGENYGIMVRLPAGASWSQAAGQIAALDRREIAPSGDRPGFSTRLDLEPLQRGLTAGLRSRLLLLWAAVGVVLLVGCVNLSGLLLARAAPRREEIAMRMTLGGGRGAVVRQLLAESLVLAAAGGAAGVGFGSLALVGLRKYAVETLGVWQSMRLDGRVLAAAALLSLLASVLFGLAPALAAARRDPLLGRGAGGHRGGVGVHRRWPLRALVVAEVALVVVLLVGAGLLVRTLHHLGSLPPGFDPGHLATAKLSVQDDRYAARDSIAEIAARGLARLREVPGVEAAGVGLALPYERALNMPFSAEGPEGPGERRVTTLVYVTPGYFEALGIPLVRGRTVEDGDVAGAAPIAVVNRAFESYLGSGDAMGRPLFTLDTTWRIVGVVGDVQQTPSWGDFGPLGQVPAIYLPLGQTNDVFLSLVHTWFTPSWVVRTAAVPAAVLPALDRAVAAAVPQLPASGFHTIDRVRAGALSEQRFEATLLSFLALLSLVLAAVGLAGLIAGSVAERGRELGLRMALGATRPGAVRVAALPGVLLAAAGVAIGSLAALPATAALRHLVYGVGPHDPLTFTAVAAILLLVAALASLAPAVRVARLDPGRALREG